MKRFQKEKHIYWIALKSNFISLRGCNLTLGFRGTVLTHRRHNGLWSIKNHFQHFITCPIISYIIIVTIVHIGRYCLVHSSTHNCPVLIYSQKNMFQSQDGSWQYFLIRCNQCSFDWWEISMFLWFSFVELQKQKPNSSSSRFKVL